MTGCRGHKAGSEVRRISPTQHSGAFGMNMSFQLEESPKDSGTRHVYHCHLPGTSASLQDSPSQLNDYLPHPLRASLSAPTPAVLTAGHHTVYGFSWCSSPDQIINSTSRDQVRLPHCVVGAQ